MLSAMACASRRVPPAKRSNSKTPTGPFHSRVEDAPTSSASDSADSGPMSRIRSSSASPATGFTVASASALKRLATTTSVGSGMWVRAIRAVAVATRSGSHSDWPMLMPFASKKVLAMPPPTISWSTMPARLFSTSSLLETLAPPTMASIGRLGLARDRSSASSSPASKGPAQAVPANSATP